MVKLGILDVRVCKNIYIKGKYKIKIEHFFCRLVLMNQLFARTLTIFGFRFRMTSVKLFVFGVKIPTNKCISCY